jgi:hypothetical protein
VSNKRARNGRRTVHDSMVIRQDSRYIEKTHVVMSVLHSGIHFFVATTTICILRRSRKLQIYESFLLAELSVVTLGSDDKVEDVCSITIALRTQRLRLVYLPIPPLEVGFSL